MGPVWMQLTQSFPFCCTLGRAPPPLPDHPQHWAQAAYVALQPSQAAPSQAWPLWRERKGS